LCRVIDPEYQFLALKKVIGRFLVQKDRQLGAFTHSGSEDFDSRMALKKGHGDSLHSTMEGSGPDAEQSVILSKA
jgi:hypothetical protein